MYVGCPCNHFWRCSDRDHDRKSKKKNILGAVTLLVVGVLIGEVHLHEGTPLLGRTKNVMGVNSTVTRLDTVHKLFVTSAMVGVTNLLIVDFGVEGIVGGLVIAMLAVSMAQEA